MICYIEKIRARFRARFRALVRARFRARFHGPFRGYYGGPSLTDCRSWALRGASMLQNWQESTLSRISVAWKFMESSSCYVPVSTRPWPHFLCPQTPFAFRSSWNNLGLIGATLEPSVIKKFQSDLLHSYPWFWRLLCGDIEAIILGTSLQVPHPRSEVFQLLKMYHRVTRETTLAVGHYT